MRRKLLLKRSSQPCSSFTWLLEFLLRRKNLYPLIVASDFPLLASHAFTITYLSSFLVTEITLVTHATLSLLWIVMNKVVKFR
jgi:hypothetical protein